MSYYWAIFQKVGSDVFRYDTRIYLKSVNAPSDNDICIGAVVGKNPGSAKANNINSNSLQQIRLDGDKLLPTVRNILIKSYQRANRRVSNREYIQILNLFYLCDPKLSQAISLLTKHNPPIHCASESKEFPWIWYVWGPKESRLSKFKSRFRNIKAGEHFFVGKDKDGNLVVKRGTPSSVEFVKHTQRLQHDIIVPFISELVDEG